MKKFLIGILFGFLYIALLLTMFYMGVVDECRIRGYNSALVWTGGVVCVNTSNLERDEFHIEVGSF